MPDRDPQRLQGQSLVRASMSAGLDPERERSCSTPREGLRSRSSVARATSRITGKHGVLALLSLMGPSKPLELSQVPGSVCRILPQAQVQEP